MLSELLSFASGRAFKKAHAPSLTTAESSSPVRRIAEKTQESNTPDLGYEYFTNLNGDRLMMHARVPNFRHLAFGVNGKYFFLPQTARTPFEVGSIDFAEPLPSPLPLVVKGFEYKIVDGVCYVEEIVIHLPRTRGAVT